MHRSTPIYDRKGPFVVPININEIFYNCNRIGHESFECRNRYAWNKFRNTPRMSRNTFIPFANYKCMDWKRKSNHSNDCHSISKVDANTMCFSCYKLGCRAQYYRSNQMKSSRYNKKVGTLNMKYKGSLKFWRRKKSPGDEKDKKDVTMSRHCAFHAQVVSPKC